jgi:hypothetical protein
VKQAAPLPWSDTIITNVTREIAFDGRRWNLGMMSLQGAVGARQAVAGRPLPHQEVDYGFETVTSALILMAVGFHPPPHEIRIAGLFGIPRCR